MIAVVPDPHLPTDELALQLPEPLSISDWQRAEIFVLALAVGRHRRFPRFFCEPLVFSCEQVALLPLSEHVTKLAPASDVRKPVSIPGAEPWLSTMVMKVCWLSASAWPLPAAKAA